MSQQSALVYSKSLMWNKSNCVICIWIISSISSFLCKFQAKAAFMTAFDENNHEIYTTWNNTVIRQSAALEELDKFEFDSDLTILEITRTNTSVYVFCCVKVGKNDHPSCFLTDITSRTRFSLNITIDYINALNLLRYEKGVGRTLMFTHEDDSVSTRYLSVIQHVVYGTHHHNTTAIAIFTIDLNNQTITLHECGNFISIVNVESTIVLHILSQFYYKRNMYYVANYPEDAISGSVIINIDTDSGLVLETAYNCFGGSNISNSVTTSITIDRDEYLLTSHVLKNNTVMCSIKMSEIADYFNAIKLDLENKEGLNVKITTKRYDMKVPVLHTTTTLFVSQATPMLPIRSGALDLAVTKALDNTILAHLVDELDVVTIPLFENSQIISVDNVSGLLGQLDGILNYNNRLYVYSNTTIEILDLTDCGRHGTDNNNCLRDKGGCSLCQNTTQNGTTLYCGSITECGTGRALVKSPSITPHAVDPLIGPAAGSNIVNIDGEELDMVTNITITIGDKNCHIIGSSVTSSSLQCVAPPCAVNSSLPVTLTLDGKEYKQSSPYRCVLNPIIKETVPPYAIKSGGTHILLKGENLNLVTEDMSLVFQEEGASFSTQRFPCVSKGNDLQCLLPPINPHWQQPNIAIQLVSQKSVSYPLSIETNTTNPFYIDVRPDPVIGVFVRKEVEDRDVPVSIKGKYLDNVLQSDIRMFVALGTRNISNATISATRIVFSSDAITGDTHYIKIAIGENLIYSPGVILKKYARHTFTLSTSTATPNTTSVISVDDGDVTEPNMSRTLIIIIPVTCVAIIVTIVVTLIVKSLAKRKKTKKQERRQRPSIVSYNGSIGVVFGDRVASRSQSSASVSDGLLTECAAGTSREILRHLEQNSLIIKRINLTLGKMIGRGNFGSVYKGVVKNNEDILDVAVKTLHQDAPRDIDIQLFLKEAFIMKDFQHENVMTLVGICLDLDDMPLVILPFMEHGDLLSYLHEDAHFCLIQSSNLSLDTSFQDVSNDMSFGGIGQERKWLLQTSPTIKDLVAFGLDIAKGMSYLAQLKFVHRDLAARNCMLDSNYVVKIADFGLSRDIYETSYYSAKSKGTKLPVKWMAIDSLTNGEFNEKTDVWSFGVTLWELMTRGVRPYATVDNWDMERYLNCGRRLPQPLYCPNQLYKVMRKCWAEDPGDRPSFAELQSWISEMLDRVHHQLGNTDKSTNIETTYVNLSIGPSYHYENEEMFSKN